MNRRRACAYAAVAFAASGCAAPRLGAGVASSLEPPPRHPDGVLLDPPPAMPPTGADAPAEGVAALREPMDPRQVARLVTEFFRAFERASLEGLSALLAPDAGPLGARARGRAPLLDAWRQRLQAHDYTRLAGLELVRAESIRRWSWDELGTPGSPPRPADMHRDEVYVRVPLEVTHAGGERLFGEEADFVLRQDGADLRIAAYAERGD